MTSADAAGNEGATRRIPLRVLRAVVSIAALAWLFSSVDVSAVFATLRRLPVGNALAAEGCVVVSMCIGAARHRALLGAYGASSRPSFLVCLRLFFVGFFYNTFLPGSVAGDAVRAVGARESFGEHGTTASFAVVLVERLLGLFGLVVVAGLAFAMQPLEGVSGLDAMVAFGVAAAVVGVVLVAAARRLGGMLPSGPGRFFRRLPSVESPLEFGLAITLSLASQLCVAFTGHALISGLAGEVPLLTSVVVVPVGAASAYVPITVSGLGVREAAFARLYELGGVPASAATAFALAFLGVQVVGALVGGLLTLVDSRHA